MERVQWAIRPESYVSLRPPVFDDELPINNEEISEAEIDEVLSKLQKGKAPGHDNRIPEFWKICGESPKILKWIKDMCNTVWQRVEVPHE